jgi:hypothetical protein
MIWAALAPSDVTASRKVTSLPPTLHAQQASLQGPGGRKRAAARVHAHSATRKVCALW